MKRNNFTKKEKEGLVLINELFNKIYELNKDNYNKEAINLYIAGLYFLFLLNDLNTQHTFLYEIIRNSENSLDALKKIFNQILPITDNKDLVEIFKNNRLINHIKTFELRSNEEIKSLVLKGFTYDWASFSPLLFNSLFENNLEYTLKQSDGIHYTTEENIRKVLDPLFLEDLENRLEKLESENGTPEEYEEFLREISQLTFLDPASGAGNFLIIAFLNLVKLEKRIKDHLKKAKKDTPYTIDINNFYGIEINPIAALIAQMGLQIAELYKNHILSSDIKTVRNNQVVNDNALTSNWNSIINKNQLSYIIGNPPFLGARKMNKEQKGEIRDVFGKYWPKIGNLDYSSGWFKKASDFIKNSMIEVGFVSTTSLFQGEIVSILWEPLLKNDININFAYKPFLWEGTGSNNVFVYVTAIGFSDQRLDLEKYIIDEDNKRKVDHINGYLLDLDEIYPRSRSTALSDVPDIGIGNKPIDGGNYLFSKDEKEVFIKDEPGSQKFFKPFYGASDFLKNRPRYCLDLTELEEEEIATLPKVKEVVKRVIDYRLKSPSIPTQEIASTPMKFHVKNKPGVDYLVIPRHTSENRVYLPIGYLKKEELAGDSILILPSNDPYYFGVLTSKIHMDWVKYTSGRLGNGLRYSKELVYNNFPWPKANEEDKNKVRKTALKILNLRNKYKDISLQKLYQPQIFPEDLRQAHEENDKLVEELYGFESGNTINELLNEYKIRIEQN